MPIWLRKFTISQIKLQNEKENKQLEDAKKSTSNNSTSANIGDAVPDHMKQVFNQSKPPSSYTTQRAKK